MNLDNQKLLKEKIKKRDDIIVLPGVFDALSAKISERVGFEAMFQTGYGSAATLLGLPDFAVLNGVEHMGHDRRIIRAVDNQLLVDVDTGYGKPLPVLIVVNDFIA